MFLLRLIGVLILVARGSAQANIVEQLLADLHRVVSGVQLGITLTSLAIGALGEITVATLVQSVMPTQGSFRTLLLIHAAALAISFLFLSAIHVVLGELVPK